MVFKYFNDLYKSRRGPVDVVLSCVEPKVTREHNEMLMAPFRAEEVKEEIFSMHNDKASGEDGFNPAFYKRYWVVVGEDVTGACLTWLSSG